MPLILLDPPGAAMHIHASNRIETLADWLAEQLRHSPAEPLEPERIVVPDPLLGQWLRLELATRLGVAAHLRVELHAEFAWNAMREEVTTLPDRSVFGPSHLRWRIFDELANLDQRDKAWNEVGGYVEAGDDRMRFELADQLAIAYDRCRVYRPQEIRAWEEGTGTGWHAALWQRLASRNEGPQHWVAAIDRYRDAIRNRGHDGAARRERVSFFHIAALSPTYVELLHLMASVMEVHLYLLSPETGFWNGEPAHRNGASSNELLNAWGRSARDLREQLLGNGRRRDSSVPVISRREATGAPEAVSCLAGVQRDILLPSRQRTSAGDPEPEGSDNSIQVHSCHSPTREAEVLHDVLLDLFDENQDIQPADVLVLTPDVDTYAPLIDAVFSAAGVAEREGKGRRSLIGVNIGTRRLKEGAAMTAFLALLDLPGSRYTASDVLAPLLAEAVRDRFRISETGLGVLRTAVAKAGIRWGIDANHRAGLGSAPIVAAGATRRERGESGAARPPEPGAPRTAKTSGHRKGNNGSKGPAGGVPASENHNWRRGLDRLLLGYAMDPGDVLTRGITPASLEEWAGRAAAADYETLGRFCAYQELATQLEGWLRQKATAAEWARRLREEVVERFFSHEYPTRAEARQEVRTVARLIDEFAAECEQAGHTGVIPFPVLRDTLNDLAEKSVRAAPRLADGMTVASLASGQIFPAKVICAVGMSYGAFPRRPQVEPFDFQAELFSNQAPGDPSRRNEDRHAFLEALLAARKAFVVTYTGRDLQDDKPRPPSVLVSDLTDYLDHRFVDPAPKRDGPPNGDDDPDRTSSDEKRGAHDWTTQHPLQPFSRRYFEAAEASSGDDANGEEAAEAGRYGDANAEGNGATKADERRLFSYSQPMRAAAEVLLESSGAKATPRRFEGRLEAEPRTEAADRPMELQLERLVRFSESPSRDFLRYRLGTLLETREPEVANDEPFDLDALEMWQLKKWLVDLGGVEADRSLALTAASGLLPPENLGKLRHKDHALEVAELLQELERYAEHREANPYPVEIELESSFDDDHEGSGSVAPVGNGQNVLLVGAVDYFSNECGELLFWRVGNLRAKDRIQTWLRLLAVTCERGEAASAHLRGLKGALKTERLEGPDPATARKLLSEWVAIWKESQVRPLPFFAETSWCFVEQEEKAAQNAATAAPKARQTGGSAQSASAGDAQSVAAVAAPDSAKVDDRVRAEWPEAVLNNWTGSERHNFSDGRKAWHRLMFPEPPETPEFKVLARRLLGPLMKARTSDRP